MKNLFLSARVLVMSLLFMIPFAAGAQNLTVTGHVADELGDVIGASVLVKGTTNGTVTDMTGAFTLDNVAPDATVIVSFIGYKDAVIPVDGKTQLKVVLKADAQLLSEVEVVAVGYGDVRRRDLTGSISKANVEDLTKTPVSNIAEALGGRVAGVQVTSGDGGLNEDFNFVIRGAGSLTQSTQPLFVIDGFPSETSGMSSINPNDIKSIDVLKDASATAIYGSRAANGVIIITTKEGFKNEPEVSYNGSVSVSHIANQIELMGGYDFVALQQEIMPKADFAEVYLQNGFKSLEDYRHAPTIDWQDEFYRTAVSHNHHVNISGGNKGLKYSASAGFSDRQGVIIGSDLKKYQGRFNLSQKIKSFKITANGNFSSNVQKGANPAQQDAISSNSLLYSVWAYRPVSPSGNADLLDQLYDSEIDMTNDYRFNPIKTAINEYRKTVTNTLALNVGVEWEIIKNLKLKVTGGYTARDIRKEQFNGRNTRSGNDHPSNLMSKGINARLDQTENRNYLNENTLTYSLNKNRHAFNALLGLTFEKGTMKYNSIISEHIPTEAFGMAGIDKGINFKPQSMISERTMMSYFARINYNYDSRYYLTASMRADGSSKFAPNHRWGYFPSASVAWAFARESFVKDSAPWLSTGKLRASWGLTGNNRIGDFEYMSKLIMDGFLYKYPFNNQFMTGFVMGGAANPALRWETTEQMDFGIDLGFLDDRISLTFDYYIKNTHDLLLEANISATSGYETAMINVGKLRNHGFEVTLQTVNIKKKNFMWTSNLNFSVNMNRILALNSGEKQLYSKVSWSKPFNETPAYISAVGQAAGQMYGYQYDGTYRFEDFNISIDKNGEPTYTLKDGIPTFGGNDPVPGDPKFKDIAGGENGAPDGVINDADRTVIGNGQSLFIGGFTNNFTYRNWDLNIFLQFNYGNDILNANRLEFENIVGIKKNKNQYASFKDRWTPENPYSDIPRAGNNYSYQYSSFYIEDGSFLKLKNISLGYTFKKKQLGKSGINSLRLYLSADNIATLTAYSGGDPEVSTRNGILTPGFDWSAYPRAFSASFGLNLVF